MKKPPQLKTAMTPFPYSVQRGASVGEARELMQAHNVRHLPVTEQHTVIGVISERDLPPGGSEESSIDGLFVGDPYVVDLNHPFDEVLMTMSERHIGSAIVTKHGQLAGMFTNVDACRSFAEFLRDRFPHPHGDDAA